MASTDYGSHHRYHLQRVLIAALVRKYVQNGYHHCYEWPQTRVTVMDQQIDFDRVRGLIINATRAVHHIAYHHYACHVRCKPFDLIAQHNGVHQ